MWYTLYHTHLHHRSRTLGLNKDALLKPGNSHSRGVACRLPRPSYASSGFSTITKKDTPDYPHSLSVSSRQSTTSTSAYPSPLPPAPDHISAAVSTTYRLPFDPSNTYTSRSALNPVTPFHSIPSHSVPSSPAICPVKSAHRCSHLPIALTRNRRVSPLIPPSPCTARSQAHIYLSDYLPPKDGQPSIYIGGARVGANRLVEWRRR